MEHHKSPVMPLPHLVTNNKGLDPSENVQYIPVSEWLQSYSLSRLKSLYEAQTFELQEHTAPFWKPLDPFYLVSSG